MLFRQRTLEGIRSGEVTVAFRRWRRPTVRAGGTLLTAVGELEIADVTPVTESAITAAEAYAAGFESREALLAELNRRSAGTIYRVDLGALRPDPRIALRETRATGAERDELLTRLRRLDARAPDGPWTAATLALIHERPAVRAGDLAPVLGMEREPFKINVRKLKNLGLTESLGTGYRLSPRGTQVLAAMRATGDL